jgi:hypothetical protein
MLKKDNRIVSRDLSLAKIDAVLSIQRGDSHTVLFEVLLSHFEDDVSEIARSTFKDYFNQY